MRAIRKKLLTDENMQPVAVQIDYPDWLWLESWMNIARGTNGQPLTGPQDVPGTPSQSLRADREKVYISVQKTTRRMNDQNPTKDKFAN